MDWIPVKSSDIEAIAYDRVSKVLSVKFKSGGVYSYRDVPELMAKEMLEAESVGRFFHGNIKGHFDYLKEGDDGKGKEGL